MLQPFVDSITDKGEISMFYFGKQFSHAIQKIPAAGDFRVQEDHGGHIQSVDVAQELRKLGQQTLQAIDRDLLYARVDVVQLEDGSEAVMEIELIEPSLYLAFGDDAAVQFARALDQTFSRC